MGMMSKGNPHICARCAEGGNSCCWVDPAPENCAFPLSVAEWGRIILYLHTQGVHIQEEKQYPHAVFYALMERLFPHEGDAIQRLFPQGQAYYIIPTRPLTQEECALRDERAMQATPSQYKELPQRACIFLGRQGCILPRRQRPRHCVLYPFWIINNEATLFLSTKCLASQEAKTPLDTLTLFAMPFDDIETLYAEVRASLGLAIKPHSSSIT